MNKAFMNIPNHAHGSNLRRRPNANCVLAHANLSHAARHALLISASQSNSRQHLGTFCQHGENFQQRTRRIFDETRKSPATRLVLERATQFFTSCNQTLPSKACGWCSYE